MKLLPYDTFVLEVNEPVDAVLERLRANTYPSSWWDITKLPYFGTTWCDGFKIMPVRRPLLYRPPMPVFCGKLQSKGDRTSIQVTARVSWPQSLLLTCLPCAVWIVVTVAVFNSIIAGIYAWPSIFLPLFILLCYLAGFNFLFWSIEEKWRGHLASVLTSDHGTTCK